jgi:hypothetical protein
MKLSDLTKLPAEVIRNFIIKIGKKEGGPNDEAIERMIDLVKGRH